MSTDDLTRMTVAERRADPRTRKAVRQAMQRDRPIALAEALTKNKQFRTVAVTVRSHDA